MLSSVCQTGPLGTSDSTGTVTEPRIVLFHTMSQSYIVTFIYGSVGNESMKTMEMHQDNGKTSRGALHELMNLQQFCQDEKQHGKLQKSRTDI